jgi:aminoglycoside N3'-acetyltransferase
VTSPFYRIREYDGLVIGLGTRYRYAFTIGHVAEELNPRTREYDFEERPRKMIIRTGDQEIPYEFRVLRPELPREFDRLTRTLRKEKLLRYVTVSGLPCAVLRAGPYLRRAEELAEQNLWIIRVPEDYTPKAAA